MKGRKPALKVVSPIGGTLPGPPSWLTAGAKREWLRSARDLNRRGLLFDGALASLATYCTLVDQIEQFGKVLAGEGIMGEEGKVHDGHRAMMATAAQARMLAAELGLSVVSRARAFTAKTPDRDGWDEVIGA